LVFKNTKDHQDLHFRVRICGPREAVTAKIIRVSHIATDQNLADMFMKCLVQVNWNLFVKEFYVYQMSTFGGLVYIGYCTYRKVYFDYYYVYTYPFLILFVGLSGLPVLITYNFVFIF